MKKICLLLSLALFVTVVAIPGVAESAAFVPACVIQSALNGVYSDT